MAKRLSDSQLRSAVSSATEMARDGFRILQEISLRINQPETHKVGVKMVMRALEHRDALGELEVILDAMIRSVGLFPYANEGNLSLSDRLAFEYHRPLEDSDIVFHRLQADIYRRLIDGESVILSAPTSFGKSRLIDDVIRHNDYRNVVIVVPTLALIDETRRRVAGKFKGAYKIITHHSQPAANRNIFVMTPERVVAYEDMPKADFFVIDEFYKVGAVSETDSSRVVTLNHAFYKLNKMGGQFYLLGPNIDGIPPEVEGTLSCSFLRTDFSTVVTERIRVKIPEGSDAESTLVKLCRDIEEPTLIYCSSPGKATAIARRLVEEDVASDLDGPLEAAEWIGDHYSPEWVLPIALRSGIGIHHARIPRSLGQYVIRAFNEGKIRFLICTSTLIEGVNTSAKNVIVYDKKVSNRNFDFFTFNNIVGRSGRMFKHFVGRVYLFHDPPSRTLPFVDFPFVTQNNAPPSLLVQLEDKDLTEASESVLQNVMQQDVLPIEIIRENASIDPDGQILLAKYILDNADSIGGLLAWSGFPRYPERELACSLIWSYFVSGANRARGVTSFAQLNLKIGRLIDVVDYPTQIAAEVDGTYVTTVDEAVDRILGFERNWATFHFPRYLMALHRIQEHVLTELGLDAGDYAFFASRVEALFRNPVLVSLEEFGLPLPLLDDLDDLFPEDATLDEALSIVSQLEEDDYPFDEFELELVRYCKSGL